MVPVPVTKHEHRMWFETEPAERAKWSKRNYYRFLDRWRDRWDLVLDPAPAETTLTGADRRPSVDRGHGRGRRHDDPLSGHPVAFGLTGVLGHGGGGFVGLLAPRARASPRRGSAWCRDV